MNLTDNFVKDILSTKTIIYNILNIDKVSIFNEHCSVKLSITKINELYLQLCQRYFS